MGKRTLCKRLINNVQEISIRQKSQQSVNYYCNRIIADGVIATGTEKFILFLEVPGEPSAAKAAIKTFLNSGINLFHFHLFF
jgi:hypothetical protein